MPKGQYQRRSRETEMQPVPMDATEIAEVARLLAEPVPAPAIITRESFNDWLDAEAVTMPPNDRFTQMVGEWAASFCDGEHSVTWLPSLDRTSLTVTLITPYGTSELVAPAGQWREADIAEALASMRVQLGV